jgi:hypothetical protein
MKRLLVVFILMVVGVLILGYCREWYKVTTTNDSKAVNVNVMLDKEKLKEDEEKAKEKLRQVGGQIKEKAGSLKKGADEKTPGDQPQ